MSCAVSYHYFIQTLLSMLEHLDFPLNLDFWVILVSGQVFSDIFQIFGLVSMSLACRVGLFVIIAYRYTVS